MPNCHDNIREKSGKDLSDSEINRLLAEVRTAAEVRSKKTGQDFESALKDIAGEALANETAMQALNKRNTLLNIAAKRKLKDFAARFSTPGEGLLAYLEGSPKNVDSARLSVDYQGKVLHQKYFGSFITKLEDAGVMREFMSGNLDKAIYQEMGALHQGTEAVSGSKAARIIAEALDEVTNEMVARQNRAGAYIAKLPGYVVRQTHDRSAIRAAGGGGNNPESKAASYSAWSKFVIDLLDHEKTFQGADPAKFLRNVHEGLYTGVHGDITGEADLMPASSINIGKKASSSRVLHFKDAESAYKYNQAFGTKNLRDSIFSDIYFRSRNISLMEALGPNPEAVFNKAIREIGEEARLHDDAAARVDSLKDWRLKAAFDTVTGRNDLPVNVSLSKFANTVRSITTLSKMGATVISAITDKGFFQTEMAFQGMDQLKVFAKQITLFAGNSPEKTRMLRLMGVALDGLIGNTVSRYTIHTSVAGVGHRLQQKLFDINFLNWWTDAHKGAAAELMAGHLGEHAGMKFSELPGELSKVLSLYNISPSRWDAIRSHVVNREGQQFIIPGEINIPEETLAVLVKEKGLTASQANIMRERDAIDSAIRTYIADRVDHAIPTPGADTKKYITMGTQAGTPLGEAVRMLTLFKSFPIAVLQKVIARDVYGGGADSIKSWLLHDTKGKFRVAQTIAMTTALGYISMVIRDALKGRTPKELTSDGKINFDVLREAMLRGGGAGIMADTLMTEYDTGSKNFLQQQVGPVYGQLSPAMNIVSKLRSGQTEGLFQDTGKLTLDNTPFINLFYIRPVLDYIFLWNLQEMMDPGSLERMEKAVERKGRQEFFFKPSETVK